MDKLIAATFKSRTFWVNIVLAVGGIFSTTLQPVAEQLQTMDDSTVATGVTVLLTVVNLVMRYLTQAKIDSNP